MKIDRAGKRGVSLLILKVEEDDNGDETTAMQKVLVHLKTAGEADTLKGLLDTNLPST